VAPYDSNANYKRPPTEFAHDSLCVRRLMDGNFVFDAAPAPSVAKLNKPTGKIVWQPNDQWRACMRSRRSHHQSSRRTVFSYGNAHPSSCSKPREWTFGIDPG